MILQGSVYLGYTCNLSVRAGIVRVDTGLSTHVHINIAEYYNDSPVYQSSPLNVNGPVLQTPSLKRKSSDGTSTHTKICRHHAQPSVLVQRSKFDGNV